MQCIIDNQVVLARAPEGPLAAYISSSAKSLREQGYAVNSIHRQPPVPGSEKTMSGNWTTSSRFHLQFPVISAETLALPDIVRKGR